MVEALFSSPVVGQLHAPNPTSSVKDMEVALASGSTDIQKLDVKHAKASQQAAAGSRNFSRSTGRPMGRLSEPQGTRPCGRSRKQSAVHVMKRSRIEAAGMKPGPGPSFRLALLRRKLSVWRPAIARLTMRKEETAVRKKSCDPPHQAAAPFAAAPSIYPGTISTGCKVALATAKAASSAAKAPKYHAKSAVAFFGRTAFNAYASASAPEPTSQRPRASTSCLLHRLHNLHPSSSFLGPSLYCGSCKAAQDPDYSRTFPTMAIADAAPKAAKKPPRNPNNFFSESARLPLQPALGHGFRRTQQPIEAAGSLEWRELKQCRAVGPDEPGAGRLHDSFKAKHPFPSFCRHSASQGEPGFAHWMEALQRARFRHAYDRDQQRKKHKEAHESCKPPISVEQKRGDLNCVVRHVLGGESRGRKGWGSGCRPTRRAFTPPEED